MTGKNTFFAFLTAILWLLPACQGGKNEAGDPCSTNFDQESLFQHLADKLILPRLATLQTDLTDLQIRTTAFVETPTITNLSTLRSSWQKAYVSYQQAAPFQFGPAAEVFLRNSLNNFPLNVGDLEENIRRGTYDFNNPDGYDKGFPALDYLLYGLGADEAAIVTAYVTGPQAEGYRRYLSAVVDDMVARVNQVQAGWTTGGYRAAFIQNTGTAAGSSLSLIINQLNEHYEQTKRDRIGIPSGVVTLGFTNPDKVEAFYSGLSIDLALAAVRADRELYLGWNVDGVDGPGLDDYLNAVRATKNGRPLDTVIQEQFAGAITALEAITGPLSQAVDQQGPAVQRAYNELTRQVVNLKTDMPSVLCVAITYVDNPSDSD